MIRKTLLLATLVAIPTLAPSVVQAKEYCREYTKTVSIGGKTERAYGTACQQPDGAWEIQTLEGSDYGRNQVRSVIYDDLNDRYARNHVVVRERYVTPKPRYTYHRASYHSPFVLNFGFNDRYKQQNRSYQHKSSKNNNSKYNNRKNHR